jgi:2-phospho-L-lactate/phosphoenolpyruvate guanylyltransferase
MNGTILVPMKEPAHAKSRMAPLLAAAERAALAWAMFEDLIAALIPVSWPVAVATNSLPAPARAEALGWQVFWEEMPSSESASVDAASRRLARQGVHAVLRLPADLPLIRTADVEELLTQPVSAPAAVLVPSRHGSGTNALLRMPPDLFPSCFGPDSFALHARAAAAAGAGLTVVQNARLALDLDDPADLACFLAAPEDSRTYRALMGFHVLERLADYGAQRNPHPGLAGNS